MNLATEQFKLPWEPGEPLIRKIHSFTFRETYDKQYVMSAEDFLARGEVIENAIKNTYLCASKQSNDLNWNWKDSRVGIDPGHVGIWEKIPECFGKFIPTAKNISGVPWAEFTMENIIYQSSVWSGQFFEHYCDFWCLFLLNPTYPHDLVKGVAQKPVWVKLSREDMFFLWKPRYDYLRTKGLVKTPGYENFMTTEQSMMQNKVPGVDISSFTKYFPSAKSVPNKP